MAGIEEQLLSQITQQIGQLNIMNRYMLNRVIYKINDRSDVLKNPFNAYGKKTFSQTDEDGLTFEIIKRLNIKDGVFAEFGVGNGLENNTLSLVGAKWHGFWVGNEDLAVNTNPTNESKLNFTYLKGFVRLDNIIDLLKSGLAAISKTQIDLISLDLDGNDLYFVKKILDDGTKPSVFIVEYNSKFAPPIEFAIDYNENHTWDHSDYFGASLASFNKLFAEHGYFLVCCNAATGSNAFFVKNEFKSLFPEVPDDLDRIWCPPMYFIPPDYGHPTSVKTVEVLFKTLQQDGKAEREQAETAIATILRARAPLQVPPPGLFSVELTGHCNINCAMCARSAGLTRPTKHMDIALFKEIVDQSKFYNMPIGWMHHFGETLMYPHLREALSYFKQNGLGNGAISTNAILLNEEKRDILLENSRYILCDMDSMNPDAYKNIRNNKFFTRVRDNIANLIAERDKRGVDCKIVVQFLRTSFNKDESISDMMDYFGHHDNLKYIEKGTVKHPRGGDIAIYSSVNKQDYRIGCYMAKRQLCIMCTGECASCCWDANGEQVVGDVRKQTIAEIWQGHEHRQLQARLDAGDFSELPLCAKCGGPDTGDEARVVEQVNLYVDDWKARNARVAIGPYSESMFRIIMNTRMSDIAPAIFGTEHCNAPVPGWATAIKKDEVAALKPDVIFIYSPDRAAEAYFDMKHHRQNGSEVVVIGSFID